MFVCGPFVCICVFAHLHVRPLSLPSGRRPSAHSDRHHSRGPGAGGADRRGDLLVPSENCWVAGVVRRGPLQPHQLQPVRAGREEHPGVGHGAERAARVAELCLDRATRPEPTKRRRGVDSKKRKNPLWRLCRLFWNQKRFFEVLKGCVERSRYLDF